MKSKISKILFAGLLALTVFSAGLRIVGFSPYAVETDSMSPEFPVGSLVYVKAVDFDSLKTGDVITFVADETLSTVTHRIVAIDSDERCVTTKGDANATNDILPVYADNIVGKALFKIPYLGALSSAIRNVLPNRGG